MMKRKTIIFVLVGLFALLFIGASVFFALQGVAAKTKEQEYLDVYRSQAEEYIQAAPQIISKYGDNVSVTFDGAVMSFESGEKSPFDKYVEVFMPRIPDTLEEFSEGIDRIKFNVTVNGDAYEITFEKNNSGKLCVSSLTALEN